MKALITLVSATAILSTCSFAESTSSTAVQAAHQVMGQEQVKNKVQNEVQNRFKTMKTDELLEKRGTMTSQQEREQLHNELKLREKEMTKEQKNRFNKRPPENRIRKGGGNSSGSMGGGMGSGGMGGGGGGR